MAFVKDNFSKAILHKAILPDGKAGWIRDLVKTIIEKFKQYKHSRPINIISDGGSENKGPVLEWVAGLGERKIAKITAKVDFPFVNNMSESTHHIFKSEFLQHKNPRDESDLREQLDHFEEYYNWNRFPVEPFGLAPMEVVNGAIPYRNHFKEQTKQAQQKKIRVKSEIFILQKLSLRGRDSLF